MITDLLRRAGKLNKYSCRYKDEHDQIMKTDFWEFLIGHSYWAHFLTIHLPGYDLVEFQKIVEHGTRDNLFGNMEFPKNWEIDCNGEHVFIVIRSMHGSPSKDIWMNPISIRDLEKIDEIGKKYDECRADRIQSVINEVEEDIQDLEFKLMEKKNKKDILLKTLKEIEKD